MRIFLAAGLAALVLGCAPPPSSSPPAPPLDAQGLALRLEATRRLVEPVRILFDWRLSERDGRFRGRGVARVEPPYKARLDLFLPSGETALQAALVNDDLRLPLGAPEGLVPPPEMLWGTLGVFRPSRSATLEGGRTLADGRAAILYRLQEGIELLYMVGDGGVQAVERLSNGRVVERLAVESEAGRRFPSEATYRNLAAFRELTLTRREVTSVELYPPDIWKVAP